MGWNLYQNQNVSLDYLYILDIAKTPPQAFLIYTHDADQTEHISRIKADDMLSTFISSILIQYLPPPPNKTHRIFC